MYQNTNVLDRKLKASEINSPEEQYVPTLIKSKSVDDYNRKLQFLKYDVNSIDRQISNMTNELATDE